MIKVQQKRPEVINKNVVTEKLENIFLERLDKSKM